jgi:hypothetical protein
VRGTGAYLSEGRWAGPASEQALYLPTVPIDVIMRHDIHHPQRAVFDSMHEPIPVVDAGFLVELVGMTPLALADRPDVG